MKNPKKKKLWAPTHSTTTMASLIGRRSAVVFYGDGIGREIVQSAQRVLDASLAAAKRAPLHWHVRDAGEPGA